MKEACAVDALLRMRNPRNYKCKIYESKILFYRRSGLDDTFHKNILENMPGEYLVALTLADSPIMDSWVSFLKRNREGDRVCKFSIRYDHRL